MNTRQRIAVVCIWSAVVALAATLGVAWYVVKRDGVQGESFPPELPASHDSGPDYTWFYFL